MSEPDDMAVCDQCGELEDVLIYIRESEQFVCEDCVASYVQEHGQLDDSEWSR